MFDIEGCELAHHGEDVSFNSFLKRFNLGDLALARSPPGVLASPLAGGPGYCTRKNLIGVPGAIGTL
jgi:hypothetical protein